METKGPELSLKQAVEKVKADQGFRDSRLPQVAAWIETLSEEDKALATQLLREKDFSNRRLLELFQSYGYEGRSEEHIRLYRRGLRITGGSK